MVTYNPYHYQWKETPRYPPRSRYAIPISDTPISYFNTLPLDSYKLDPLYKPTIIHHTPINAFPPKSLDRLLSYFISSDIVDPIEQTWQDKLKIARFKISSLVNAINVRNKIREDNMYHINNDICSLHTAGFALDNNNPAGKYAVNTQKIGLEKAVAGLEKDKRSEIVGFWSDILLLRKDLTDAIHDYLALRRKMNLLGIQLPTYYHE